MQIRINQSKKLMALLWSSLFCVLALNMPRPVSAQQIDLSVSPPVNYIRVEPGKTFRLAITISQNGTIPLQVTPRIVDFVADSVTGEPQLLDSTDFKYVKIQNEPKSLDQPFLLKPGSEDQVVLFFDVPEDARAKEYHLSLLFSAEPDADLVVGGNQTSVSAVIASNIIVLTARSDQDLGELHVSDLQTPLFVDSLSRITFNILAENKGPTATKPHGKAVIRNFSEKVVADFPFYPDVVLAQSSRPLRAASGDPEVVTNPEELVPTEFAYDPTFLFGPYRVEITLENPDTEEPATTVTKVVWAFPFSIVLFVLGIAVLIIIFRSSGNILIAKSSKNT